MSDRTIIGGMSKLHAKLIAMERDLEAKKKNDQKYYTFQEENLAQLRVTMDDMEVMLGIVRQPGSERDGEGQRELPAGPPKDHGSGAQATFTANGEGGGGNFQGADL